MRKSTITTSSAIGECAKKGDLLRLHDGKLYKIKKVHHSTVLTIGPYYWWAAPLLAFVAGIIIGFVGSTVVGQLW